MKERPILFSSEMVRAILDGRKTQTRRVIKWQPPMDASYGTTFPYYWGAQGTYSGVADPRHYWTNLPDDVELQDFDDEVLYWPAGPDDDCSYTADVYGPGGMTSPYGSEANCLKKADRLWVRETTVDVEAHGYKGPVYFASREGQAMWSDGLSPADDYTQVAAHEIKLRPSIFMPRRYARITLEITGVRVERLHDISDEDAWAEGVQPAADSLTRYQGEGRELFLDLWRRINGEASLDANPWVWAISFKQVTA